MIVKSSKYKDMRFYSRERVEEITQSLEEIVVIPVNEAFEGENRIYSLGEMEEILRSADKIASGKCGCRREYGNCNSPLDGCISLDTVADYYLENEPSTDNTISVEKALELLRKSHDAGLVHISYTMKDDKRPGLICSCCPCCCHTLGSLVRNGTHPKMLTSKYIARNDAESCIRCGKCVDRCAFDARVLTNEVLLYDSTRCFGCGLCLSTCPNNAISLTPRE